MHFGIVPIMRLGYFPMVHFETFRDREFSNSRSRLAEIAGARFTRASDRAGGGDPHSPRDHRQWG